MSWTSPLPAAMSTNLTASGKALQSPGVRGILSEELDVANSDACQSSRLGGGKTALGLLARGCR